MKHNLGSSNPQYLSVSDLLAMASPEDLRAWEDLSLSAVSTFGSEALRAAIAGTYNGIGSSQVLCFAGAEEGLFVAMQCLLAPEDHAIVLTPNYQAAETLPLALCDVSGVALVEGHSWRLDLDGIRKLIRRNTKLISINFPHNPTGMNPTKPELNDLITICRDRGIYLFSDEVYRFLEYEDHSRLPAVADTYELGVSLNVTSKAYALTGLRIGWIATQDRALLRRMERCKHYLSICNSTPSEHLATIALKNGRQIIQRNLNQIRNNLSLLNAFFGQYRDLFEWSPPAAGCIAYPRFLGRESAEEFVLRALKEAGVFLLPPSVFRSDLTATPADRFRIGFGRNGVQSSLEALGGFVDRTYR